MCAIYSSAGAASAPIYASIAHRYIVQSLAFGSLAAKNRKTRFLAKPARSRNLSE